MKISKMQSALNAGKDGGLWDSAIQHTPGPWELGRIEDDHVGISALSASTKWTNLATVVWKMSHQNVSPIAQANARLIAASPELLECLRGMLESFEVLDELLASHFKNPTMRDVLRGAFMDDPEKARAAIAKAAGKDAQ